MIHTLKDFLPEDLSCRIRDILMGDSFPYFYRDGVSYEGDNNYCFGHTLFNDDDDFFTNQQTIGHKNMFRGVMVKEWIVGNEHCVNFHNYNKILIKCSRHIYLKHVHNPQNKKT